MTNLQRNAAQFDALGDGRFRVGGVLDASTVTRILEDSVSRFRGVPRVVVDFAAVTASDSSGLALLLEWIRQARKGGQQIHFEEVPEQIMALARISEVDDLLLENGGS
ncbi:MAG TPA: STAS domain-containing protein, partial [Povalibacter sp.]|nr:STAS domain-containing protein [Povalibacter sp.]